MTTFTVGVNFLWSVFADLMTTRCINSWTQQRSFLLLFYLIAYGVEVKPLDERNQVHIVHLDWSKKTEVPTLTLYPGSIVVS